MQILMLNGFWHRSLNVKKTKYDMLTKIKVAVIYHLAS